MVDTDLFTGSQHARFALPTGVSRRRVEGGAPYLYEHDLHGVPHYPYDQLDTAATHPLAPSEFISQDPTARAWYAPFASLESLSHSTSPRPKSSTQSNRTYLMSAG